jgi:hypothetical protein
MKLAGGTRARERRLRHQAHARCGSALPTNRCTSIDHTGVPKQLHVLLVGERALDEIAKVSGRLQPELLLHPLGQWRTDLFLAVGDLREDTGVLAVDVEVKERVIVLHFAEALAAQRPGDFARVEGNGLLGERRQKRFQLSGTSAQLVIAQRAVAAQT